MKKQIIIAQPVKLTHRKTLLKEVEHARSFLLIQDEDMEFIKEKLKIRVTEVR